MSLTLSYFNLTFGNDVIELVFGLATQRLNELSLVKLLDANIALEKQ